VTRKGTAAAKGAPKGASPAKPKPVGKEDPAFYEALGRAIKVARTELGIERRELAEQANVSYAYLSDIETGRGRPGSRSLLAIAEALGRPVAELMHDAEMYRQRMTGEAASYELAPGLGDMPTSSPRGRKWFHEGSGERTPAPAMAADPDAPSYRELRSAWRERLTANESRARAEMHELIDRLSPADLDAALTIARRLARSDNQ
jgi:transcriptional regulator with XRE-family HTH domain